MTVLGFTFFLNYRDPWPPLVPRPLEPEAETAAPREPPHGNLNLAPLPEAAREPVDPGPPQTIPVTSLPLRLLATAVQEDTSRSFARIQDSQLSGARLMAIGKAFEGRPGVKIVAIEPSSVLIDNQGILERVPLAPEGRVLTGRPSPESRP